MTRILFVCIGNSCRSPMAEGFARARGDGLVEAESAGLYPADIVQPETIQVMAERGIAIGDRGPRLLSDLDGAAFDLLVNMSGLPLATIFRNFRGREIIWDVPDPIGRSVPVYRSARDHIEKRVARLLEQISAESRE